MIIAECESFPIEQVANRALLEACLAKWFIAHPWPARLLAYSHRFDIRPILRHIQQMQRELTPAIELARGLLPALRGLLSGDTSAPHPADAVATLSERARQLLAVICTGDLRQIVSDPARASASAWLLLGEVLESLTWTRPYLDDSVAFYERLGARHLRAATYVLVIWEPSDAQPDEVISSLSHATGRRVYRREQLPAALRGRVTVDEGRARLVPERPGDPWMAVLRSYELPVPFDATLLHPLMDLDHDLVIALDVQTLGHSQAQTLAELQLSAARVAVRTSGAIDPQTELRAQDAERTLYELRTQSLHQVQVAVLVYGEDADGLARNVAATRDRLGVALRMEAVRGSQAELLRLFSTTPAAQIDAAWRRDDMLSHGLGCLCGIIGYHRPPATDGWLWGIDAFRRAPIFFDPFAGGQAGHMVVLGETGYGKSFFLNLMTLRAAVSQGYRVIWVDAYENAPRIERAVGGGARRHVLSLGHTINPLDIVYGPEDGAAWQAMQVQHVIGQLALLMGNPAWSVDGRRTLLPRIFTKDEAGYLERAVQLLYADVPHDADASHMPILSDLITALEEIDAGEELGEQDEREARALARTLRKMLYGSVTRTDTRTATGASFNGVTSVDWAFADDVVCFDLTEVQRGAEEWLPLYYAQAIGAIYRYMRDPARDRSRKTLLVIDEFGLAAQIKTVAQLAVTISKVARKYGVGLITADQLPLTYLASVEGRQILDNARIKVMFHLDDEPAREIARALPQLSADHIAFLTHPIKGECVVVFDETAVPLVVEPAPRELLMLEGS